MLDHLGVVVRAELDLAGVALRVDRQEADHIREERVRRDLALGVLVQEVVDLPRLVTDPQVVRRLAHDVVEEHVVGAEDLVHPAERVERVQVVVRPTRSPSAPTPRPARRWRGARPRRAPRRTSVTGDCASHSISRSGTRSRSARAMARSRSTWPRPIGEQTHSARRLRSRAKSHGVCVGAGVVVCMSTNSLISVLTSTGWRACGTWPAPSISTSRPPVTSATARPRSTGWQLSSVPWITSTGQVRFASASRASASSTRSRSACEPDGERLRVGLQRPRHHVLVRLGRVRLGEHQRGVVAPPTPRSRPTHRGWAMCSMTSWSGRRQRHRTARSRRLRAPAPAPMCARSAHRAPPQRATRNAASTPRSSSTASDVTDVECVGLVAAATSAGRTDRCRAGRSVTTRKCRAR